MIKVKRIDHVAIAVADRDGATRRLVELFGLCPTAAEHVADQQTDVAFLHSGGSADSATGADDASAAATLEVIAPAGNAGLARFLDRRGPGLHHICFEVDDLPAALDALRAAGVRLIDETPRPGARGHLVAFLHPSSTGGVLYELCATPHAPGAPA